MRNFTAIYSITNIINNKIYIGQSIKPFKRYLIHINYPLRTSKKFGQEIIKYGKENFIFKIIEWVEDEGLEKEKYYISLYRRNNKELYNLTKGGESPPHFSRNNNVTAKYSEKQLNKVIELLLTTNLSYKEIANKTKTSVDFVTKVNSGINKPINNILVYPIRKESHFDKIAKNIIYDLQNSTLNQKEISKKYGVARSMVTMINIGQNRRDNKINYPIRKGTECPSKYARIELEKGDLSAQEIANKYNLSLHSVRILKSKLKKQLKETCND